MYRNEFSHRRRGLAYDRFSQFLSQFREYERTFLVKEKEDEFLDAYSEWLRTKNEKSKLRAIRIALELEVLGEHLDVKKIFSPDRESQPKT